MTAPKLGSTCFLWTLCAESLKFSPTAPRSTVIGIGKGAYITVAYTARSFGISLPSGRERTKTANPDVYILTMLSAN